MIETDILDYLKEALPDYYVGLYNATVLENNETERDFDLPCVLLEFDEMQYTMLVGESPRGSGTLKTHTLAHYSDIDSYENVDAISNEAKIALYTCPVAQIWSIGTITDTSHDELMDCVVSFQIKC
ncbi:MAG: hypothetical protein HUJ96_06090 [Marinilabiliaceae bacterium]|nr:hypothetical protein [Marinilabiliaceae bacterium]